MDRYLLERRTSRVCLGERGGLEGGDVDFLENVHSTEHSHETDYTVLANVVIVSVERTNQ
jgi:hypothetical protein